MRSGTYDDYPDYFDHVPAQDQIIGFDGAGIVEAVGSEAKFKAGDEVFYSGSPVRPGSNQEYQLVDGRSVALKPRSLSWSQAAAMPLTYVTAYEALVERLHIPVSKRALIYLVLFYFCSQVRHIIRFHHSSTHVEYVVGCSEYLLLTDVGRRESRSTNCEWSWR